MEFKAFKGVSSLLSFCLFFGKGEPRFYTHRGFVGQNRSFVPFCQFSREIQRGVLAFCFLDILNVSGVFSWDSVVWILC